MDTMLPYLFYPFHQNTISMFTFFEKKMGLSFRLCLLICVCLTMACHPQDPKPLSGKWIDLTYGYGEQTLYWPTSDLFRKDTVSEGLNEDGYYYSAYSFCTAEHGGTHVDAPIHFAQGRQSVDQLPIENTIGAAIVVDVSEKVVSDRDYQVKIEDLEAWEQVHGAIPDGAIVLLRTGFGKYWPDALRYMGTAERGAEAVAKLHFPGLQPEAAEWISKNRKIKAIGIDTPSIDYGQSKLFQTHRILAGQNIPIFENVANLDLMPMTGAFVVALPVKIEGGSGGPLRIVALLADQ